MVEEILFYIKKAALSPVPPPLGAIVLYHTWAALSRDFQKKVFYFFEEKGLTNNSTYAILLSEVRKSLKEKEDENMTKQEMVKRFEELDRAQFELMMKDMWDAQDYELDRHYTREIQKLKEAMEG